MKKASINIVSALVILLLTVEYIIPSVTTLAIIISGFTAEATYDESQSVEPLMPVMTIMSPSAGVLENPTDTIVFDGGVRHPAILQEAIVMVPEHRFYFQSFIYELVIYAVNVILSVIALYFLIRFIINVSRGTIFTRPNGRYLRVFGWLLIALGGVECCNGLVMSAMIDTANLSRAGYTFLANWEMPWNSYLLGCVALFLGQVWKLGISMREEQELTI